MHLRSLVEGLNANERMLLLALREEKVSVSAVVKETGLDQSAVMRAALGLSSKDLVEISESRRTLISLTGEGETYAREGMPERRLLKTLAGVGSETLNELAAAAEISRELAQLAFGWMMQKGWAKLRREVGKLEMTNAGEKALTQKLADEQLLEKLAEAKKLIPEELPQEFKSAVEELKRRKLVKVEDKVTRTLYPTDLGKQAISLGIKPIAEVSELTHDLLASGRWREVKFKRYDVAIPGALVYPGKIHPQQRFIDEIREILLEMGFAEVKGPLVESEFWNFDALFQAQDHPAREIHASLSVSKPARTLLPSLNLVRRVATAHERGVAGSRGWGCKFNPEISRRPVMCSQTTAATVRYLARRPKPPVKVFCIDRTYRHDKIDYKHLAEFYQCEGIVMDPKLTLRDMLGYLKQIVVKLGLPKIRFRPGFFPFTEPSVEADIYHEGTREWIEVLGAGLFRPEVLHPLGIRYPVLAWGLGLSRLIALRYKLEDIRDLFNNDLQRLSSFVYPVLR